MFPLRDDNPTAHLSIMTMAIIAANLAVWILVQGLGDPVALTRSVCSYGLIPAELLHLVPVGTRVRLGQGATCMIGHGAAAWITPFTSMFMHGGWFHIIGNLWFFWVFGNNIEDALGHLRFVLFYLACGLAAASAQVLANPSSTIPMVGASGAIGGVMGAYAVLYPRARVHVLLILGIFIRVITVPAFVMLGYWFLLQVLGGLPALESKGGGVAFWAHIGGFSVGVIVAVIARAAR